VCHALLRDASLYDQLLTFDHDLAAEARAAGCGFCNGSLHSARYPRKPRAGLDELGPEYATRLSFCCAVDGCRRRTTPPSVRYLGRRVYLGAVVVLVTAMTGGITATRAAQLREWLGVSVRTLKRWHVWWRETFVASPFWRGAQGRFMPPVGSEALPASLLERFAGDERTRLLHALAFLAPLTTRRADRRAGSAMAGGDPQTMRLVPGSRRS
jgi:hypothetical protein